MSLNIYSFSEELLLFFFLNTLKGFIYLRTTDNVWIYNKIEKYVCIL